MAKKEAKRSKILDIRIISLIIGAVAFLVIGYLSEFANFPLLVNLDAALLDQLFRDKISEQPDSFQEGVTQVASNNPKVSSQIVIIGIDTDSLQELGRWPWTRSVQSLVLQAASRISDVNNRERAFLMDIFYTEYGDPEQDIILYNSIAENGRVFLENIPDWDPPATESEMENLYERQDSLLEQFGEINKVDGPWEKMVYFMNDELPLPLFASALRGYGHAQYSADQDQVYRNARMVARFSRLTRTITAGIDNIANEISKITVDRDKFEWIAWSDKKNYLHEIDSRFVAQPGYLDQIKKQMEIEALTDRDENGRVVYRIRVLKDVFIPSIVLSLALEYYHKEPGDVHVRIGEYISIPDPEVFVTNDEGSGEWRKLTRDGMVVDEVRIPIDDQGMMMINFMGASSEISKTYPVFSFYKFADTRAIPEANSDMETWPLSRGLANKIVIVCAFSKGMASDEKMTPFGLMYGGEIHANALNTVLMSNYLLKSPLLLNLLIILGAVFLSAFISARLPPLLSLFIIIWLLVVFFFVLEMVFENYNVVLKYSSPSIGIFFTFLAVVAYRVIFEEQDKRRIKLTFTKYVSPTVVDQLLVNPPELGGVDKEISVLFSDIRGYTTLSETMTPQALVNHLNLYLTKMTDTLIAYEGTLDKYVGDMVMGFWGAPLPQKNHAILGCKCALKMMEELGKLNETWPVERRIDIGIGINSGIMTVGNMGSPMRMNYTLMGDNVNLGSRLEGTNKEYGTHIIISEYTYGLVRERAIVRELDNIRVKGKNKPVLIYELVGMKDGLDPAPDLEV